MSSEPLSNPSAKEQRDMPPETVNTETRGPLIHSEELNYLNRSYALQENLKNQELPSGCSTAQELLTRARQKLSSYIKTRLLVGYLSEEREFHASLVRCLNQISRSHDSLEESLRLRENLIRQTLNESSVQLRKELGELRQENAELREKLHSLDCVARGLERIVACLGNGPTETGADNKAQEVISSATRADYAYLLLENRYRGSEEEIARRLSIYPPLFNDCDKPVLEIGAGRGELQTLFKQNSIKSYGVELNPAMVALCANKGLDVQEGDAIEHLDHLEENSLGGIIAIQVIEHLPQKLRTCLFELSAEKVQPGGKVIFETINTESLVALAQNYFRDPTHVSPLHPETVRFAMELAGLKVLEVRKLSPFPIEAQLQQIPPSEHTDAALKSLVDTLNHNLLQLNRLLFGYQDYCVIAEVV